MARLTKRLVDLAVVPEGRAEGFVWDASLPGFGLRVMASGRKTYLIQYRDMHGRTRRYALGAHGVLTVEQARTMAQTALARVRAGENPSQERQQARQAITVIQLAARFEREHLPRLKPTTQGDYRLALTRHILPYLGTLAVPAVSTEDLAAVQTRLAAVPYQANRVLSVCRTLFACAERWGMRATYTNPALGLTRYPEKKRERYLTPEELARLGAALAAAEGRERPEALALLRLLVLTGARLGEIRTLRWEWIDWRGRRARLPDSKTGAKTLYLSQAALAVLEDCGRRGTGLVVPGVKPDRPQAHPQHVWRRVCRVGALTDLRLHDLRHTYASCGVMLGLSLPMVGHMLGHREWTTTQRYAHLAPDPVQEATERVGEALAMALGG